MEMTRSEFAAKIHAELDRAYAKHGRGLWGRHEFYAILKEEVDEVWDAVKCDEPSEKLEKEIIQVAAMCLRYLETGDRYRQPNPEDTKPAFLRKIMD
jgi:NTP pyrophosphatase (non-canonical NTP hydrolase)